MGALLSCGKNRPDPVQELTRGDGDKPRPLGTRFDSNPVQYSVSTVEISPSPNVLSAAPVIQMDPIEESAEGELCHPSQSLTHQTGTETPTKVAISISVGQDSGRTSSLPREPYPKLPEALQPIDVAVESGDVPRTPTATVITVKSTVPSVPNAIIDSYIEKLLAQIPEIADQDKFCLSNTEIQSICLKARELFLSEPAMIEVPAPVKIVGDTHGQFNDVLRMFRLCGFPSTTPYLFLGDYVDRGKQGLETMLLLFCYKIKHPKTMCLLRGNHEAANVNRVYGFFDECKRRCSMKVWKTFCDVFNSMPIAAVVAKKIFCVHGGLSPDLPKIKEILNIRRPTEVPEIGLVNDLLWSDPSDAVESWEENDRGVSFLFGRKVVTSFLERNGLDLVCRAHMVVEDGYEFFGDRSLVTIFSAPNYCGEFNNCAAVMCVSPELLCSFEILKPMDYSGKFSSKSATPVAKK